LLAVFAVLLLTWQVGSLPWVSLVLAFSFGFYGLLRKLAQTESIVGLTIETSLLTPAAAGYIVYLLLTGAVQGGAVPGQGYETGMLFLLMGTGLVTAIPLILFSMAATRLTLSTLGLMQYLAPSMHVILAVFIFKEPVSSGQLLSFGLIWISLIIYSWDGLRRRSGI
jgi:chloramphenicol-sensitive protein RarD